MFEYQGGTYPGVWVYDGSGAQIVGVRLYLTPSVLSDPIPLSQVRIVGSQVGGIVNATTPPLNPPPGTVWLNSGSTTQSGIPPGQYGYWNGSTWVLMGSQQPTTTPIAAPTAPPGPQPGQIWQNTSGLTVAGVPAGQFAYWNGSTWVPLGTAQPQLGPSGGTGGAGVTSVNNLQGAVSLAEGSGIDITQSGNTITFTATGVSQGTPGVSSLNGQSGAVQVVGAGGLTVGTSAGTVTLTAPPPGQSGVASFNTRSGAVVPVATDYPPAFIGAATPNDVNAAIAAHVGASDPHAQYLQPPEVFGADFVAANSAPTGAVAGQVWRNTNSLTVAGIPSGNYAVRTPAGTWFDAGPRYPFAVNNGSVGVAQLTPGANNTFLQTNGSGQVVWSPISQLQIPVAAQNPGFTARFNSPLAASGDGVVYHIILPNEVADPLTIHNPATGVATIPPDLGGLWEININMTLNFAGGDHGFVAYSLNGVNNLVALSYGQVNLSGYAIATLNPGDQIRAHAAIAATGNTGQISNLSFSMYLKYKL